MQLPLRERVIYQKNPLNQVICQVRFPPILRIDDRPAGFQEKIRANYPSSNERFESQDFLAAFQPMLPEGLRAAGNPIHDFASADKSQVISLSRGFIALTTRTYFRWEHFRHQLEQAITALLAEYRPAFHLRIGLRYRNIIPKKPLAWKMSHGRSY